MSWLDELREYVSSCSTAPTLEEMPRRSLEDKGISGPTGAHRIEEIHTPLNFSYITLTTGSTAFQNIVGVTEAELDDRIEAALKALSLCGIEAGDEILFTYPPLVNVFPRQALDKLGVRWSFLKVSGRDAVILALCERQPKAVIGESSFLRATLESARSLGLQARLPRGLILVAVGTPLDLELPVAAEEIGGKLHDLYGCQEFGWLTLDGIPLRSDIYMRPVGDSGCYDLLVGGLPTGDRFPLLDSGHICNRDGKIITYSRERTWPELETTVLQTTASSADTVERLTRTILRIKAKIVRVSPELVTGADCTALSVSSYSGQGKADLLQGHEKTRMFDSLLRAQLEYQAKAKNDKTWKKTR